MNHKLEIAAVLADWTSKFDHIWSTQKENRIRVLTERRVGKGTSDQTVIFDGSYKIDDNGVLTIVPEDNSKPKLLLSPGYWHEVSESRTSSIGGRVAF